MTGLKKPKILKKLVKVHAVDHTAAMDWKDLEEVKSEEPNIPWYTGYIIYKDKNKLIIASDYDPIAGDVGNRTILPRCTIKKIEVLHEEKK